MWSMREGRRWLLEYEKVIHCSDSEAWLRERTKSAGASDPLDNTSAKRKAGLLEPFMGNVHTEAGQALESAILNWWGSKRQDSPTECGWLLRREGVPFIHATLDGWVEGEYVVEIKNVGLNQASKWLDIPTLTTKETDPVRVVTKYQQLMIKSEVSSQPPRNYFSQVQHQLYITGLRYGYLVGLIGGKRLVEHYIKRDDKFIYERVKKCEEFMKKVEKLRIGNNKETKE